MDFDSQAVKNIYIYINHTETETGVLKSWKSHKRKRSQTAGKWQYLKGKEKTNNKKNHVFQNSTSQQHKHTKTSFHHSGANYYFGGFKFHFHYTVQKRMMIN